MRLVIGRRHQHVDVLADDFGFAVAEEAFRGMAEGLNDPALVNHDNPVGDRVQDRAQPRLAFTKCELGCLALAQVADEPDENCLAIGLRFVDRQIHREHGPVFAAPRHLAPDPDDLFLASCEVIREIAVMFAGMGLRHQHLDVLPGNLRGGVAEHLLGRLVDGQDQAFAVDDDDAVERGVEHRPKQRIAVGQTVRPGGRLLGARSRIRWHRKC